MSYRVDIAIDGTPLCTCPGFENHGHCWHTEAALDEEDAMSEKGLVPVILNPTVSLLPSERDFALIEKAARLALAGALALPKELNTPEKIATVMLYGWELGLRPLTAIRHIYIVEGRPQPSAEVMAALLLASEQDARLSVVELTDEFCTMRIVRPSKNINETYTVTLVDAEKAGLTKRDGWLKYPKDRLRWHCTKRILRIYAPDATNAIEAMEHPVPEADWREIDKSEMYNEGDTPIEPGDTQQQPEAVPSGGESHAAGVPVAAPPPTAHAVDLAQLLNDIQLRYRGGSAARDAVLRMFGTMNLITLDDDQRAECATMLRVRLEKTPHEHSLAYGPNAHPLCSTCGEPMEEETKA